jgi:hypothetical protein
MRLGFSRNSLMILHSKIDRFLLLAMLFAQAVRAVQIEKL